MIASSADLAQSSLKYEICTQNWCPRQWTPMATHTHTDTHTRTHTIYRSSENVGGFQEAWVKEKGIPESGNS